MTTLKEIAIKTGFSVSVVSRALNTNPDKATRISKETRLIILKTAKAMGYTRNRFAEFLKRGKHPVIGVFLPEAANRIMADLVYGIAEAATRIDFPLRFSFGMCYEQYRDFINNSKKNPECGLITYPYSETDSRIAKMVSSFRSQGNHMVLINSNIAALGVPYVTMDETEGGRIAARRLLESDCSQYVLFGSYIPRNKGFNEVLNKESKEVLHLPNNAEGWSKLIELRKKSSKESPLGVFAVTDILALAVIRALRETPFAVGREVKLIGYDDLDFTEHLTPALTTINQPFKKIGILAVDKILALMEGKEVNSEMVKPRLVARETA